MEIILKDEKLTGIVANTLFESKDSFKTIATRATTEQGFDLVSVDSDALATISDNMKEINRATNSFGKTYSQYEKSFFTLTHQTPYRNLKQILAEIEKKRGALKENEHNTKIKMIDLAEIDEKIKNETNEYKKAKLFLKKEKVLSDIADSRVYFEGTLKEIYHLQSNYNDITKSFNITDYDEIDVEEAEEEYHIKRAFEQGFQNFSNQNQLGLAEQEYFVQNGINPLEAKVDVIEYINSVAAELQKKRERNDFSRLDMNFHYEWLDRMAIKYKGCNKEVMERKGIRSTYSKEVAFKNEEHLKLTHKE